MKLGLVVFEAGTQTCALCHLLIMSQEEKGGALMIDCGDCDGQHFMHIDCVMEDPDVAEAVKAAQARLAGAVGLN